MAVFNAARRDEVMNKIIEFTKANDSIIALVAVGSGAYGYNDELSDIDMVVALDDDKNMEEVMEYNASKLREIIKPLYFKQVAQRRLQVFLGADFLEIDIGYGAYTKAAAFKKDWRVLFDKSGTVDRAMRSSWERIEASPVEDRYIARANACADSVWFNLMHAAVAIKRGSYWRAFSELETARNSYIGLLACRYSLDSEKNKDIDKLPAAELELLRNTLTKELTGEALLASLEAIAGAVYKELGRAGEKAIIPVDFGHIKEYIAFCQE